MNQMPRAPSIATEGRKAGVARSVSQEICLNLSGLCLKKINLCSPRHVLRGTLNPACRQSLARGALQGGWVNGNISSGSGEKTKRRRKGTSILHISQTLPLLKPVRWRANARGQAAQASSIAGGKKTYANLT